MSRLPRSLLSPSQEDTELCEETSSSEEEDSFDPLNFDVGDETFQRVSKKRAEERKGMIRPRPNRQTIEDKNKEASSKEDKDGGTSSKEDTNGGISSEEDDLDDSFDPLSNTITDSMLERYGKKRAPEVLKKHPVRPPAARVETYPESGVDASSSFMTDDSFDIDALTTSSFLERLNAEQDAKVGKAFPRTRPDRSRRPSAAAPSASATGSGLAPEMPLDLANDDVDIERSGEPYQELSHLEIPKSGSKKSKIGTFGGEDDSEDIQVDMNGVTHLSGSDSQEGATEENENEIVTPVVRPADSKKTDLEFEVDSAVERDEGVAATSEQVQLSSALNQADAEAGANSSDDEYSEMDSALMISASAVSNSFIAPAQSEVLPGPGQHIYSRSRASEKSSISRLSSKSSKAGNSNSILSGTGVNKSIISKPRGLESPSIPVRELEHESSLVMDLDRMESQETSDSELESSEHTLSLPLPLPSRSQGDSSNRVRRSGNSRRLEFAEAMETEATPHHTRGSTDLRLSKKILSPREDESEDESMESDPTGVLSVSAGLQSSHQDSTRVSGFGSPELSSAIVTLTESQLKSSHQNSTRASPAPGSVSSQHSSAVATLDRSELGLPDGSSSASGSESIPVSSSGSESQRNPMDAAAIFNSFFEAALRRQAGKPMPDEILVPDSLEQECPISATGFRLTSASCLPFVALTRDDFKNVKQFLAAEKKKEEQRLARLGLVVSSESDNQENQKEVRPLRRSRTGIKRTASTRPIKPPSEIYSQVMSYHYRTSSQTQSLLSQRSSQSQSQSNQRSLEKTDEEVVGEGEDENNAAATAALVPDTVPAPSAPGTPERESTPVATDGTGSATEPVQEPPIPIGISTRDGSGTKVQQESASLPTIPTSVSQSGDQENRRNATVSVQDDGPGSLVMLGSRISPAANVPTALSVTSQQPPGSSLSSESSNDDELADEAGEDSDSTSDSPTKSKSLVKTSRKSFSRRSSSRRSTSKAGPASSRLSKSKLSVGSLGPESEPEGLVQKTQRNITLSVSKSNKSKTVRESEGGHKRDEDDNSSEGSTSEPEVQDPHDVNQDQLQELSGIEAEDIEIEEPEPEQQESESDKDDAESDDNEKSGDKVEESTRGTRKSTFTATGAISIHTKSPSPPPDIASQSRLSRKRGRPSLAGGTKSALQASRTSTRGSPRIRTEVTNRASSRTSAASISSTSAGAISRINTSPGINLSSKQKSVLAQQLPREYSDSEEIEEEANVSQAGIPSPAPKRSRPNQSEQSRTDTTVTPSRSLRVSKRQLSLSSDQVPSPTRPPLRIETPRETTPTPATPAVAAETSRSSVKRTPRERQSQPVAVPEPEQVSQPRSANKRASSITINRSRGGKRPSGSPPVERQPSVDAPEQLSEPDDAVAHPVKKRRAPKNPPVKKDFDYYMSNKNLISKAVVVQNLKDLKIKISKQKTNELHEFLNENFEKLLDGLMKNSARPNGMFTYRHLEEVLKREGLVPKEMGKNALLIVFADSLFPSDYEKAKGVLIPKDNEHDTYQF